MFQAYVEDVNTISGKNDIGDFVYKFIFRQDIGSNGPKISVIIVIDEEMFDIFKMGKFNDRIFHNPHFVGKIDFMVGKEKVEMGKYGNALFNFFYDYRVMSPHDNRHRNF
jgi:hypothetical protein